MADDVIDAEIVRETLALLREQKLQIMVPPADEPATLQ